MEVFSENISVASGFVPVSNEPGNDACTTFGKIMDDGETGCRYHRRIRLDKLSGSVHNEQ